MTAVCQSANYHLRNIGKVRKYLDKGATQIAIHALVTSRLDNLNSLLYGLPACQLDKLQRVQNNAARIVTRAPMRDHITPVLHTLHWLPIKHRVQFKVLTLAYKAMHGEGPSYVKDMLELYSPGRALRSGHQLLLRVPKSRTRAGDRAFSVAAPTLWNRLPLTLRQAPSSEAFKKHLKTYLFSVAFQ